MHAFSAVPDISADRKAHLATIATWLGAAGTLWFCLTCYVLAAALSYSDLGWFSIVGGAVYSGIMLAALSAPARSNVFKIYVWFPLVNVLMGMALFFYVASLAA